MQHKNLGTKERFKEDVIGYKKEHVGNIKCGLGDGPGLPAYQNNPTPPSRSGPPLPRVVVGFGRGIEFRGLWVVSRPFR